MQNPLLFFVMAILAAVCAGCQPLSWLKPGHAALDDSSWRLVNFGHGEAGPHPDAGVDVTLSFSADGRMGGYTGCNLYFGRYQTSKHNQLTINQTPASKKACPDPMAEREQAFLAALDQARGWRRRGNQLQLLDSEDATLLVLESTKTEDGQSSGGAAAAAAENAKSVDFTCTGTEGETFNVHARFRGEILDIWLPEGFDNRYLILARVRSDSGTRYQGDGAEAWDKGGKLSLTVGSRTDNLCSEVTE